MAVHIKEVIYKEASKYGLKIFNDFKSEKIKREEFYKEVTYYALNTGFDELVPKLYPTRPHQLLQYDSMRPESKGELNKKTDFWAQPEIYGYTKQCNEVDAWNLGVAFWLKTLIKRLKYFKDTLNAQKIQNRLDTFPKYVEASKPL